MATITINFIAKDTGDFIMFNPVGSPAEITIDNVSLKEITTSETTDNYSVKEFLSGTTDEGEPIFFRADTQQLQLDPNFEMFGNLTSITTRTKRGALIKCFISIDDGDFYQIQGSITKGFSTLKIHSKDIKSVPTPPLAREIKISWRDSSKQLCRIIQSSIIYVSTTMDYNE